MFPENVPLPYDVRLCHVYEFVDVEVGATGDAI